MYLLTIHDHTDVLHETVNDLEGLGCRCPGLVLGQSVQPLQDRLDVLLPEGFLYKFDCIMVREVISQQERTHLIVLV
jgi:hypothetical protein